MSVVVIALATGVPFRRYAGESQVRVVLDHRPGSVLQGSEVPTGGFPVLVEVSVDGRSLSIREIAGDPRNQVSGVVEFDVPAGTVDVRLVEGSDVTVLAAGSTVEPGRRLVIEAFDVPPPPGADLGRSLFASAGLGANLGCNVCHSLEPGESLVGPSLADIATVAGSRVPGIGAEDYIRQSIVDPDAFTLPGYPAGQMIGDYEERLTPEELDALVAFLLTLPGEGR